MFTLQSSAFDRIIRDVTPDRVADAMKSILTNCQQDLEHRAPINIAIDPDRSRPAPTVPWELPSPLFAGLTVSNWTSYADQEEPPRVHGGYAAVFNGVVKIKGNRGDSVSLFVDDSIHTTNHYTDNLYVTNIYNYDGTPYEGTGGASFIEFTQTGALTADEMTVDVDHQWGPEDPGATATVTDRAHLFQYALEPDAGISRLGASGIAVYDTVAEKWIVIQCNSKAGWVCGTLLADMSGTPKKASFQCTTFGGSQQDIQHPGTTFDVYGITGHTDDLKEGDKVFIKFNSANGRFYVVNRIVLRWAITQGAHGGAGPEVVSVMFCEDSQGTNPTGSAFNAVLPKRTDTSVFLPISSVVQIALDPDDTWVVVSDYTCASYYRDGIFIGTKPQLEFSSTATLTWQSNVVNNTVFVSANVAHPSRLAGFLASTLLADPVSGSANSTLVEYWGTEDDDDYPGPSVPVEDINFLYPYAREDSKAISSRDVLTDDYRAIVVQQMAQRFTGTIPAELGTCGLLSDTASFAIDVADCSPKTFSPFNLPPPGDSEGQITIHNKYGWSMATAAIFDFEWNESLTRWEMYQGDTRCEDPPPEDC